MTCEQNQKKREREREKEAGNPPHFVQQQQQQENVETKYSNDEEWKKQGVRKSSPFMRLVSFQEYGKIFQAKHLWS